MSALRSTAFLLFGVLPLVASPVVFNFNSDAVGKATTFTDTVGGLSASFSSPADPGGFQITPTFLSTLTGNVLFDPGPAGANNIPLTIQFSAVLSSVSMLFATNSGAGTPFQIQAYNGATLVGTSSVSGTIPHGFTFPEGSISFSGANFNKLVLSSPAFDFAIDDLSATPVPEPSALFMVLSVPVVGWALRRRRLPVGQ